MTNTNDPMAEIRASFFVECEELLEALQDGLQAISDGVDDTETINVVFRAVHSIKGGAGAFGLEELVRFAHRFETVLEEIRAGRMSVQVDTIKVFFQCADHLSDLVQMSRDAGEMPDAATARLLAFLDRAMEKQQPPSEEKTEIDFEPTAIQLDIGLDLDANQDAPVSDSRERPVPEKNGKRYLIQFTPENELFETGNEPFVILRTLDEMGACTVSCDASKVPRLAELAPETSYLSWTIELLSDVEEAEVASAFEFVEGLCALDISVSENENDLPQLILDCADSDVSVPNAQMVSASQTKCAETAGTALKCPSAAAPKAPETAEEPTPNDLPMAAHAKSVVRVDLDRIERLVNLVGELVINQAMLSQSLENSGLSPHSDAMNGVEEFQRLTRDIQDSVMMIRAQPVKSLFQRMSRIVREASASVGKDVKLTTEGEATEVDKTVIERLADPLTHMIRNAVDHGLEPSDERLAGGKPAQGQVKLTAAHKSGRVIIEISDDGCGINREKVQQIAIRKGLVASEAILSESEIDNLLFLPGFSTAPALSDLSGRGVGMDVVRTEIQSLGGRIAISSAPGTGTTFTISLPLTLAVLDGMIIQVAAETLVLPLNTVIETLTLTNDDVEMISPGTHVVRVRSGFVPLFDLGHELGYRAPLNDYEGAVVLLIAHDDDHHAALVIDGILDQRQVVIKGLDESFYRAPGVAAATILGDGKIALILDANDIVSNAIASSVSPQSSKLAGLSA